MPRIQPIDLSNPGAASDAVARVRSAVGSVPNIFATLAHSPAALDGFLAFSGALGGGVLSPALREQLALAVAGENACDYCASAHTAIAKGAGVALEETRRNLRAESADPRTARLLGFARKVVAERGRIGDPDVRDLRDAGYSEAEIVETIAHVGINLFTNYFNHIAETVVDFPAVSASATQAAA